MKKHFTYIILLSFLITMIGCTKTKKQAIPLFEGLVSGESNGSSDANNSTKEADESSGILTNSQDEEYVATVTTDDSGKSTITILPEKTTTTEPDDSGDPSQQTETNPADSSTTSNDSNTSSSDSGSNSSTTDTQEISYQIELTNREVVDGNTQFTYQVTSDNNGGPAISHWNLFTDPAYGTPVVVSSNDATCTYGLDESTSTSGIKFDTEYSDGETRTVTVTLKGLWQSGSTSVLIKAGDHSITDKVQGPVKTATSTTVSDPQTTDNSDSKESTTDSPEEPVVNSGDQSTDTENTEDQKSNTTISYHIVLTDTQVIDGNTQFTYQVTSNPDGGPAISHWNLFVDPVYGIPEVVSSNDTSCAYGLDGSTDTTGIKFDTGYADGEIRTVTVTLQGVWTSGETSVLIKAGNGFVTGKVQGPVKSTSSTLDCSNLGSNPDSGSNITYGMKFVGSEISNGNTQFTYTVTSNPNGGPAISHWNLLPDSSYGTPVVVYSNDNPCDYGKDGSTGTTGIKFDSGYQDGETRTVSVTIEGEWQTGDTCMLIKSGNGYVTGVIPGPVKGSNITSSNSSESSEEPVVDISSLSPTIELLYDKDAAIDSTDSEVTIPIDLVVKGVDGQPLIGAEVTISGYICREHDDNGHGNDADGVDESNPGKSTGVNDKGKDKGAHSSTNDSKGSKKIFCKVDKSQVKQYFKQTTNSEGRITGSITVENGLGQVEATVTVNNSTTSAVPIPLLIKENTHITNIGDITLVAGSNLTAFLLKSPTNRYWAFGLLASVTAMVFVLKIRAKQQIT